MRASKQTATAIVVVLAGNAAGLWLLISGWRLFDASAKFVQRANPAPGRVVAYDRPLTSSAGPLQPVVRFNVNRAESHEFRPRFTTVWTGYDIGQSVIVLYDPDNPEDARVDDFWQLWFLAAGAGVFGAGLIVIPLGALGWAFLGRKRTSQGSDSL